MNDVFGFAGEIVKALAGAVIAFGMIAAMIVFGYWIWQLLEWVAR